MLCGSEGSFTWKCVTMPVEIPGIPEKEMDQGFQWSGRDFSALPCFLPKIRKIEIIDAVKIAKQKQLRKILQIFPICIVYTMLAAVIYTTTLEQSTFRNFLNKKTSSCNLLVSPFLDVQSSSRWYVWLLLQWAQSGRWPKSTLYPTWQHLLQWLILCSW